MILGFQVKRVQIVNLEWLLSQAAEAVIKESVEPLLEEYRPPGITSLKFSKLSLGTVAPKIEGCGQIINIFTSYSYMHFSIQPTIFICVLMLESSWPELKSLVTFYHSKCLQLWSSYETFVGLSFTNAIINVSFFSFGFIIFLTGGDC